MTNKEEIIERIESMIGFLAVWAVISTILYYWIFKESFEALGFIYWYITL